MRASYSSVSIETLEAELALPQPTPILKRDGGRRDRRENAARVAVKRTWTGGFLFHIVSTDYYVTFQLDSGERRESRVTGHAYGTLVEGDAGSLSVQGTRYLGFERGR
jgi:hypothetical protein